MTTIMNIPQEVFNIILGYNDISIEDIINFRCVCKQFRCIAKYDKYMEKKFFQRWSSAKKVYDKEYKQNVQEKSEENEQKDKKVLNFMKMGINCAREVQNYISLLLRYNWENDWVIDNFTRFVDILHYDGELYTDILNLSYQLIEDDNFKNLAEHSFYIDELKNLLTQPLLTDHCDLTEKYYITKLYHYMRQNMVKKKFNMFIRQPFKNLVWERIFTMIAQFVQPGKDIFYSNIEASLDNIASEVLKCLKEKHPDHSIFSIPAEISSYWKKNNIHDNHWNETEGTQIMNTLEEYIFSKFYLNEWRLSSDLIGMEYMCIDNVLKNKLGEEVIFLIIYHCVARRLGLRCDVERVNSNFFIIWDSKYPYNLKNARCFDIKSNIFLPDYLYSMKQLDSYSKDELEYLMVGKFHSQCVMFEIEYMLEFESECQNVNMLKFHVEKEHLHTRSEDVKFAVGMIVMYNSEYVGVIVGWHQHFDDHKVRFSSYNAHRTCISNHIHVHEMPLFYCSNANFIKKQTNYIILSENNKMCYMEEDKITLTIPRWVNNSEIGRYFSKFEGTHYVPNKRLARLYPQDAAITAALQQH